MRIRSLSATAFAAAAFFQPLGAAAQASAPTDIAQATSYADTTSLITTYTITRTVERVVQTTTATLNGTMSTPVASASMTLTPYSNGTASSVLGTGATQSAQPMMPTSGASLVGIDVVGLAAIAGIAGLLVV